jgi:hypothetical protein
VAAPLPDIITIVCGLLHDGDLDRSSATGFGDLGLTEPNRVIIVPDHADTIEGEQALLSA